MDQRSRFMALSLDGTTVTALPRTSGIEMEGCYGHAMLTHAVTAQAQAPKATVQVDETFFCNNTSSPAIIRAGPSAYRDRIQTR